MTKYRTASDIANKALAAVMAACAPGVKAVELCNIGDKFIDEATAKVYNQKKEGKDGGPSAVGGSAGAGSSLPPWGLLAAVVGVAAMAIAAGSVRK